jgi:3-hydroxymyristoyl/3-hydroxydecanoyl-(acyl carrier protein) dehydratase
MNEPFRLTAEEAGRRFRVEIPPASPLFAGHFPGHPILPGVAHLAVAERALGLPLAAVRSLKLRRPVGPGDVLELSLGKPEPDGAIRFELRRGGEAVSAGSARGGSRGEELGVEDAAEAASFPPVEALLPHGLPARLIRGIVEVLEEGITALAEVPPEHPLVANGLAPALLGIEAAAQAAAVLEALQRTGDPGPRIGYLVGVRDARLTGGIPVGRPFRVTARFQGGAHPLSVYEISVGDERVGTISTYVATRGG